MIKNKRGLSQVVSTILIVLLILVALAGIWYAVNTFIIKSSEGISLGDVGLDVQIQSAVVNQTNNLATVRVVRNKGILKTEIKSLRIIVEDSRNSEIFDRPVQGFEELAVRTFDLNLTENGILDPTNIIKISVAPVYVSETTGKDALSPITSTYKIGERDQIITEIKVCQINSDCGTDEWLNSPFCNNDFTQVLQYKRTFECFNPPDGFCQQKTEAYTLETCAENKTCLNGVCQLPDLACTPENVSTDCGVSKYLGIPTCYLTPPPEKIIQDYDLFDCINNTCTETIISKDIQICESPQICSTVQGSAECFSPLECTVNEDCAFGEVCVDGNCTAELALTTGTVASSWPPGLNELFDSPALPNNESNNTIDRKGFTIIFPGSAQTSCLKISEYVFPPSTSFNSYIRLNETKTNITSGDSFQIWETNYGCTMI